MRVVLSYEVFQKLRMYADNCDYEISGLGKVERVGNIIKVKDIRIFKQEVSSASTILNLDDLAKFYDELMIEGEDLGQWKLWWHSHAAMSCWWSPMDIKTINDFDTEQAENNWMLSIETNHAGDILGRIDMYAPFRCTLDVKPEIAIDNPELLREIQAEISDKVALIQPKYTYPTPAPRRKFYGKSKFNSNGLPAENDDYDIPADEKDFNNMYNEFGDDDILPESKIIPANNIKKDQETENAQ